jgi:hypothetical protein
MALPAREAVQRRAPRNDAIRAGAAPFSPHSHLKRK